MCAVRGYTLFLVIENFLESLSGVCVFFFAIALVNFASVLPLVERVGSTCRREEVIISSEPFIKASEVKSRMRSDVETYYKYTLRKVYCIK